MATISESYNSSARLHSNKGWYGRFIDQLQGVYFGAVAMTITIATIVGAIALMYIFKRNGPLWQTFVCVAFVLSSNIIPVAQQSLKWIVALFIVSVTVNAIFIIIHAF
jgi:hypothetical protein